MKGAGQVLHKAIYDLLTQNIELKNLVHGIGDWVKPDTEYPYITIQPDNSEPYDTHDTDGEQGDYLLNIWDDNQGWDRPMKIRDVVIDLIDKSTAPSQNGFFIRGRADIDNVAYYIEEAGDIYHVVIEANFFIKEV